MRIFCGPLEFAADLAAGPLQPDATLDAGNVCGLAGAIWIEPRPPQAA